MTATAALELRAEKARSRNFGPNRAARRRSRRAGRGRCRRSRVPATTTASYNMRRGVLFLNNRHHDPSLGNFISVDPLVVKTGQSYIYGGANPVLLADPSGLSPACPSPATRSGCLAWILAGYQVTRQTAKVIYKPGCWLCLSRAARFVGAFPDIEVNEAEADILDTLGSSSLRRLHSARATAIEASTKYAQEYNLDVRGSRADAIRHAYWSALMVRAVGLGTAAELGTAHEMIFDNFAADEAMDLFNNEQGRRIAVDNPDATIEQLLALIIDEAEAGHLVVVVGRDALAWSNEADGVYLEREPTPPTSTRDSYWGGSYVHRRFY